MAESSRSSPEPSVLLTPPPITMAELARPPLSSSSSSSSSSGIMESAAVSPEGLAGLACSSGLCRGHVQERGRLCGSNSGSSSTSSGESGTGEAGASAIFAACPPPAAWALALSSPAQAGCSGGGTGRREGSSSSYLGKREERVGYPVLEPSPRRLFARGRHLEQTDLGTCVPRTWCSRRRPLARPPGRRERIDGPARSSPLPRCRRQNRRSLPDWVAGGGGGAPRGRGGRASKCGRPPDPNSSAVVGGRACVRLFMFGSGSLKCLPRRRRGSRQSPGQFSRSPALRFPHTHPSQARGPLGLAQATPVFSSPPADQQGERGVWVQTCQGHFQPEREDRPAGLRRSEVYFLGDVGPSAPFQGRNGKEEASGNINLPTGREAPNLSDCMKTRTSTFITSLLPLLPS